MELRAASSASLWRTLLLVLFASSCLFAQDDADGTLVPPPICKEMIVVRDRNHSLDETDPFEHSLNYRWAAAKLS